MRHEGPTMTAREAAQNLVTELGFDLSEVYQVVLTFDGVTLHHLVRDGEGKIVLRWGQPVTTTTYHPFDEAR